MWSPLYAESKKLELTETKNRLAVTSVGSWGKTGDGGLAIRS